MKYGRDINSKIKNMIFIIMAVLLCIIWFVPSAFADTADDAKMKRRQEIMNNMDKALNAAPDSHKTADKDSDVQGGKSNVILNSFRYLVPDGMNWNANAKLGRQYDTQNKIKKSEIVQRYIKLLSIASCKEKEPNRNDCGAISTYGDIESQVADDIEKKLHDALLTNDDNLDKAAAEVLDQYYQQADSVSKAALKIAEDDPTKAATGDNIKEAAALTLKNLSNLGCSSIQYLKDKYLNSGCWACLVVERLASSFLTASSKAFSLAQKAGLIALMLGSVLWVLVWGLKNVSSLSQVEAPNVLNELIKFGFKILLAYLFIIAGKNVIKNYIITPIMGTGAVIAQQFWTGDLNSGEHRLDDYLWEDEIVTPEQLEVIEKQIAENNEKKLKETPAETTTPKEAETPEDATPIRAAEPIEYNTTEDLIQDIQKSFIEVLKAQLNSVMNSCGGACGKGCRFASCTNSGHMAAVKKIHSDAGSSFGGNVAYCQASITAAMNNLTKMIGGDVTTVLKEVASGCALGLNRGAKSENGFSAVGQNGEDVDLCIQGSMAQNLKLNVGDTIYYHKVTSATGESHKMGATSGYHAVTYSGTNQTISFNGDGAGTMCNSYYYNVQGKVLCVSCLIREKLEKNPKLANGIDQDKLAELASGYGDMTLINYNGGIYPAATGGDGSDDSTLLIRVPDVKYKGPTDILSKVVMDNILKATKVITDNTAENMVLGDSIMCYAKLPKGGAWKVNDLSEWGWLFNGIYLTNWWMWLQGGLIWATGFLLTLAVAYYLVDISFKVGFAVIAMPIVVGLWPFKLTSGKFTKCISIIAKASATYAFLGFTTYFAIKMIGYNFATDETGNMELSTTYKVIQCAMDGGTSDVCQSLSDIDLNDPSKYLADKLQLFSISFILLMFCLIYAFIIIQKSTSKLVNKFFPDNVFGDSAPMHHAATAATKAVKDLAMKPVKWAADVATYQGTKLVGRGVRRLLHGKGSGGSSDGGEAGRAVQKGGQAMKKGGKVMDKAGSALNKTKFGAIVGVPLQVAGKVTQAGGHVVEQTGKLAEQVGKKAKAIQKKMKKSLSRISKRRNRGKDKDEE